MIRTDSLVRYASRILLPVALLGAGAGCSRSAEKSAPPAAVAPTTAAGGGANAKSANDAAYGAPIQTARALVVTLEVAMVVDRVDDAASRIREDVERAGGFIADGSVEGSGEGRTSRIDIRVPKSELGAFRMRLAQKGEVTSSSEKVEDVTEAKADLEARLKSARIQEQRIQEIMRGKTASISEVLEGEKELARIRENIERLEAQKRTMEGKVTMATVKVTLSAHRTPVQPPQPAWKTPGKSIASAAEDGAKGAAAIAVYLAMAVATVGPTVLPIGILVTALVVALRRRTRAQNEERARLIAAVHGAEG